MNKTFRTVTNMPTVRNMLKSSKYNYGLAIQILTDCYEFSNDDITEFLKLNDITIDAELKQYIHDYGNDACYSESCKTHC